MRCDRMTIMKILKTLLLSLACAIIMTVTAAIALGGVSDEPVISPGKDTAEVNKIIMKDAGCTLVFSLDGHAVNIEEPDTAKCKTYSPGQTVTF